MTTVAREATEVELVRLLDHRFGDGLVYLPDPDARDVFLSAMRLGLINEEGYLTPAGRALVARHEED